MPRPRELEWAALQALQRLADLERHEALVQGAFPELAQATGEPDEKEGLGSREEI